MASDDAGVLSHLMERFHFTQMEARMFLILQRRGGKTVSIDHIMKRLYADRIDNLPNDDILKAMVCKMRGKLVGLGWETETVRGVGYRVAQRSASEAALRWYAQHIYDGACILEIARRDGVAPAAVLRGIWRLVDEHEDDEALDEMARKALAGRDGTAPAAALEQRREAARAERRRRILSVCEETAQINLAAAVAAVLLPAADLETYRAGLAWVDAMRSAWAGLAEAEADISDDANWPAVPPGVTAIAARF